MKTNETKSLDERNDEILNRYILYLSNREKKQNQGALI